MSVIQATLPDFQYEGPSYYVETDDSMSGLTSVYRFYNTKTYTHLYTGDANEANILINTRPDYQYEGLKFEAVTGRYFANCTEAKDAGVAPLYRGQV